MAVSAGQSDHDGGDGFGDLMTVGGVACGNHLGHTGDLGCRLGGGGAVTGDQHVHVVRQGGRGGDGVQNDGNDCRIIVIGDDQDCK